MSDIITLTATDGTTIQFVNEVFSSGAVKDAYWSKDKKYVVLFFKDKSANNPANKDRLETICSTYYRQIFDAPGGDYWHKFFAWPQHVVIWQDRIGITVPTFPSNFFFEGGRFKGKEKEGKWFASAKLRNRFVEPEYKGNWLNYYHILISIARAVKRMHAAGLAHSDLSYKNVLIDPKAGNAAILTDIDGLVVPGKYPPEVLGTPDFIAPEVYETKYLSIDDKGRKLPNIQTDRHALAVMIYMYLLYRHPLRGGKVHDLDAAKDEELSMGAKALFIEHPTDQSNRPKLANLAPSELPQADITKLPYTICGPYLKALFDKTFIDGLHNPALRPTADEWLTALVKTTDLMQPCQNPKCEAKWFVFDNTTKPRCPHCGTEFHGQLPVLNFYFSHKPGSYVPENYRLMVYHHQSLYLWHVNRFIFPNEKLTADQKRPVGDFHFHNGKWILINRRLTDMWDRDSDKKIGIGEAVELTYGKKILLGRNDGDRLIVVQLVNN